MDPQEPTPDPSGDALAEIQGGEQMAAGDQAPPGEQASGEHVCRVCGGSGRTDAGECQNCGGTGRTIEATSAGA